MHPASRTPNNVANDEDESNNVIEADGECVRDCGGPDSGPIPTCNAEGRVADPVHFRPDPANQNFKNRIRILLLFTKN